MPTYGYECNSCRHTFDVFQNISDDPVKTCPKCGKDVRRLINGGMGVIFKGTGFYVTDKKNSPGAKARPKEAAKTEAAACPSCPAADSCPKAVNS